MSRSILTSMRRVESLRLLLVNREPVHVAHAIHAPRIVDSNACRPRGMGLIETCLPVLSSAHDRTTTRRLQLLPKARRKRSREFTRRCTRRNHRAQPAHPD